MFFTNQLISNDTVAIAMNTMFTVFNFNSRDRYLTLVTILIRKTSKLNTAEILRVTKLFVSNQKYDSSFHRSSR